MILVNNRELIIPNNERQLGTTYDSRTTNRTFSIERSCTDGVDLADLDFKLDLKYREARTIYSLAKATTITSGVIHVSKFVFLGKISTAGSYVFTYDGTDWKYNSTAVTLSEYGITIKSGTPASGNTITITLTTSTSDLDTLELDKTVGDETIILNWLVTNLQLLVAGPVYVQIRALDENSVKWSSYEGTFFVESHINAPGEFGDLSELEQLEEDINSLGNQFGSYYTKTEADELLGDKVDKVEGKGLSTNDYTDAEKQKVADAYSVKHSHSNLALLETYTQTEANLADAVGKKHAHTNLAVLETITSALVSAWTTASAWVITNGANVLSHLSNSIIHVTASDKTNWNAKTAVSVSNTGTATDTVGYITVDGIEKKLAVGGSGGTGDYTELTNKPQINGVTLSGNKTSSDLGLVSAETGKGLSTNDYDATEKANVARNTSARHSHSNKSVLDGITSALVSAWNTASTWITTNGANVLSHLSSTSNPHSVTAAQVGLGNVNNTRDADKPISTDTQTALNAKADKDADAVTGNVAKFDANGNPIDSGYSVAQLQSDHSNLLDNPWFTINQRGVTSAPAMATTYIADRWRIRSSIDSYAARVTNGIQFTYSGNDSLEMYCSYEDDRILLGKTVTLSVMLGDGTIHSGTVTLPSARPSVYSDVTVFNLYDNVQVGFRIYGTDYPSISQRVEIICDEGTARTFTIKAMKLELGSVSTLAFDTTPDYATELLKCQRYYCISGSGTADSYVAYQTTAKSNLQCNCRFPVEMASAPTVTIKSIQGTVGTITLWVNSADAYAGVTVNTATLGKRGFNALNCVNSITIEYYAFHFIASADLV